MSDQALRESLARRFFSDPNRLLWDDIQGGRLAPAVMARLQPWLDRLRVGDDPMILPFATPHGTIWYVATTTRRGFRHAREDLVALLGRTYSDFGGQPTFLSQHRTCPTSIGPTRSKPPSWTRSVPTCSVFKCPGHTKIQYALAWSCSSNSSTKHLSARQRFPGPLGAFWQTSRKHSGAVTMPWLVNASMSSNATDTSTREISFICASVATKGDRIGKRSSMRPSGTISFRRRDAHAASARPFFARSTQPH